MQPFLFAHEKALTTYLTKEQYLDSLENITGIPTYAITPMHPISASISKSGFSLRGKVTRFREFAINIDLENHDFTMLCCQDGNEQPVGKNVFGECNMVNLFAAFADREDIRVQAVTDVFKAVWQS